MRTVHVTLEVDDRLAAKLKNIGAEVEAALAGSQGPAVRVTIRDWDLPDAARTVEGLLLAVVPESGPQPRGPSWVPDYFICRNDQTPQTIVTTLCRVFFPALIERDILNRVAPLDSPEDREFFREIVELFRTSAGDGVEQLRRHSAQQDFPGLRAVAHRVRGQALQLGALAFAETCAHLERWSAAGEKFDHRVVVEIVAAQFLSVVSALGQISLTA